MRFLSVSLAVLLYCLTGCQPATSSATEATDQSEETELVTDNDDSSEDNMIGTTPSTVPPASVEEYSKRSIEQSADFPMDQLVEFTPEMLKELCTSKYSCLEEIIYPLGWSEDGKFAYLIEEANEAVVDFTLHFIIQDTETDKELERKTYKASEQKNYEPDDANIDLQSVWEAQKETYNALLVKHNIRAGNGTQFYGLPWVESQQPYRFMSANKMAHSDLFDLDFVSEHRLQAAEQGVGQKTILKHTFGKYDMAIGTQVLGYFRSPFEDRVAVLDAFEKRGYEGPPNVLKLKIVGCNLSDGFK